MWPFRRKKKVEEKSDKLVKRLVTGLIIGGAIGSVVGKKLMEMHEDELQNGKKGIEEKD